MGFSRRQFLRQLGAIAGLFLTGRSSFAFLANDSDQSKFEILVAGDSLIWGQGLPEEEKFYSLVKNWLEKDVFGGRRKVSIKVNAHSGAALSPVSEEIIDHRQAGDDINKKHFSEVNISFPDIQSQIENAALDYKDGQQVNLIMLNGGITDVGVANTLNPFFSKKKFRLLIHQHCYEEMKKVLSRTTSLFPKAKIVVIGYFPIISTKSKVNKISRILLKIIKFPHLLQFLITNGISKQFVKILRKAMAKRSLLWFKESNRETLRAINEINDKIGEKRLLFIESPITAETCYATDKTLLWQLNKNNLPKDSKYPDRIKECRTAFDEIIVDPYGKRSVRICELAATAHPNSEGSKAYAEAIKKGLKPFFD